MVKKKGKSNVFWRVVVSAVGVALIAIAVANVALFLFGTKTDAYVTTRRFGGADNGRPYDIRYKWSVDYTFIDDDGDEYEGHLTKLGSDMSVKVDDTVYYLEAAPFINALESEVKPGFGQVVYIGLGIFLVHAMNPKFRWNRRKKPPAAGRGEDIG